MTRLIFFDSDCLSSFLWIGAESLLALCFPQGMILPQPVYDELSKVAHLKHRVDVQIELGNMSLLDIQSGTQAYRMYVDMVRGRDHRLPRIGKGEAAAIVLAHTQDGILASNNLRDIVYYIELYDLKYLTSASILEMLFNQKIITKVEAEEIWMKMLQKKRKLPFLTFQEYLDSDKRPY